MRSPVLARWLLSRMQVYQTANDALGDFEEEYGRTFRHRGAFPAWWGYWWETLASFLPFIIQHWRGNLSMMQNTIKSTFRHLLRHKTFTAINLIGLALGMACTLLITFYVNHQLHFDDFHADADRIYRVAMAIESTAGVQSYAFNAPPVGPALKVRFPQVEVSGRVFQWFTNRVVRHEDRLFEETGFVYADNSIFQILSLQFLEGSAETALAAPQSLVLPLRLARKYFGETPALGQYLNLDGFDYQITAVVADAPDNTHLPVDLFLSMKDIEKLGWMQDWTWPGMWTYVKLKPHTNAAAFARQIEALADAQVAEDSRVAGKRYRNVVQPVRSIYLDSKMEYELLSGNRFHLLLFAAVGLFILIVASVNFVNLTTARSVLRAREIGLRKTVGATRRHIVRQFLGETLALAWLALLMAFLLVAILQPLFSALTGVAWSWAALHSVRSISAMVLMVFAVCAMAGVYPALVLSRFSPLAVFKQQAASHSSRSLLRRILVIFQFAVAIILMTAKLGVEQQLHYVQHRPLGFQKERQMALAVRGRRPLEENYQGLKAAFAGLDGVESVSATFQVPGTGAGSLQTRLVSETDTRASMMNYYFYDDDFLSQFNIQLASGRSFDAARATDRSTGCLINEAAVKAFGWSSAEEALGKRLFSGLDGQEKEILGVTANFHYRDLRNLVEPLIMEFRPEMFNHLVLQLEPGWDQETVAGIELFWQQRFPDKPFQYQFVQDIVDNAYGNEVRMGQLFGLFSMIGIVIAALGVLGLSAFMTQRRTREIGVRKVLGATSGRLLWVLTRDFSQWVLLSNLIAWPISWWLLVRWLRAFPYRMAIHPTPFLISGGAALLIAWLAVSFQSIKAARQSPVVSLKNE